MKFKSEYYLYVFTFLLVGITLFQLGVGNPNRFVLVQPQECTPPTDFDGFFGGCYDVTNRYEIMKLQTVYYEEYIVVDVSMVTTHSGRDGSFSYPLLHVENFYVINKMLFWVFLAIVCGLVFWSVRVLVIPI